MHKFEFSEKKNSKMQTQQQKSTNWDSLDMFKCIEGQHQAPHSSIEGLPQVYQLSPNRFDTNLVNICQVSWDQCVNALRFLSFSQTYIDKTWALRVLRRLSD